MNYIKSSVILIFTASLLIPAELFADMPRGPHISCSTSLSTGDIFLALGILVILCVVFAFVGIRRLSRKPAEQEAISNDK